MRGSREHPITLDRSLLLRRTPYVHLYRRGDTGPAVAEVQTVLVGLGLLRAPAEEFDREWLIAQWAPNDPDGPTVILNADAPMLLEAFGFI